MPGYLILGATSDIARSVAKGLAADGHRLLLAVRDESALSQLAGELDAAHVTFDATDGDTVTAAFKQAKDDFGDDFAGAANMVGSFQLKAAHLTTDEDWRTTLALNLDSAFYCVRAAGKTMRHGGSIVLMGSVAARIGIHSHEAIAAAKAGVMGLTLSAAATYANRGLRFNCVAPGLTQTKLTERVWKNEAAAQASRDMHALGKLGEPDHVAAAVRFLLDPQNDWMTGQVLGVDGGLSAVVTKNQKRA